MEQRQQHEEETARNAEAVARLGSLKASKRGAAEQALEQMQPAEAVDTLLALLEKEGRKRRLKRRIALGMAIVFGVLFAVLIATGEVVRIGLNNILPTIIVLLTASRLQKRAASELAKHDDIRAVGPLVEALEFRSRQVGPEAERALIRLLPRLRATDSGLLNEEQRRILCRALVRRRNPHLAVAILRAFEQVGGEDVLAAVERVANGDGRMAGEQRVREAAQACLPAVRQRAENARAARTLLRPAAAPDNPADILLRPAQGAGEADPDLLLRPAYPDADP
jgi:HEAT repeat protein